MKRIGLSCLVTLFAAAGLALPSVVAPPAGADVVVPIIFPVGGSNHYSNDFGAPRSGGRTHGGNDIFCEKLTPLIAAEGGYISWWLESSGISGWMLELVGDSGYKYWYIHVNNDNPGTDDGQGGRRWAWAPGIEPGARVKPGQFIAYCGDSGNAEDTSPHLHFELHYPDDTKINPYESLNAARRMYSSDPTKGFLFWEYLTVQNPGDMTATVQPKYLLNGPEPPEYGDPVAVPPRSRRTIVVNESVPLKELSTDLTSTQPVVVERPMYFNYGEKRWTGGHVGLGKPTPQTTYYFAEGYTAEGFDEYLTIGNPGAADATVDIEYMIRGSANVNQQVVVPANRRSTIAVWGVVGRGKEVAAKVTSSIPVLVERPMYFDYGGPGKNWTGGHVTSGVSAPAQEFFFAEGYTGETFDEYLTLGNPQDVTANVEIYYQLSTGQIGPQRVKVGPRKRHTVAVRDFVGTGKDVSARIVSDQPIIAERPMYFHNHWNTVGPANGGHAAVGVTGLLTDWYFAEGYTGDYYQEYLTLQNPDVLTATVSVEYHGSGGLIATKTYPVGPRSRFTVDVNDEIGPGKEVSLRVRSDRPIAAERPMYFRHFAIWSGGHVTAGAAGPANRWMFAEGYTG